MITATLDPRMLVATDAATSTSVDVYVLFVRSGNSDAGAHVISSHGSMEEAVAAASRYQHTRGS